MLHDRTDDCAYLDRLNATVQENVQGLARAYRLARAWYARRPAGQPDLLERFWEHNPPETVGDAIGIPYPDGGPRDYPSLWSAVEEAVEVGILSAREGQAETESFTPEPW